MSQTLSPQTPPDQRVAQASAADAALSWQLEADRQLLKHLNAQLNEQLEQLAALQRAGANQKYIRIVEQQIAMLNHAIREAEDQATLHARQAEIRRVEP
jgi:peptidoglycan hydrolase CwlO-like protein